MSPATSRTSRTAVRRRVAQHAVEADVLERVRSADLAHPCREIDVPRHAVDVEDGQSAQHVADGRGAVDAPAKPSQLAPAETIDETPELRFNISNALMSLPAARVEIATTSEPARVTETAR